MAFETVGVVKTIPVPAADVWARARDFCDSWHPAIDSIREERDGYGAIVRVFGVKGETGEYRVRLTCLSDSGMVMRYESPSGIAGARMYCASIAVFPAALGSCSFA